MLKLFEKKHRVIVKESRALNIYYIKYNDYGFLETTLDSRKAIKIRGSVIPAKLLNDIWQLFGIDEVGLEH